MIHEIPSKVCIVTITIGFDRMLRRVQAKHAYLLTIYGKPIPGVAKLSEAELWNIRSIKIVYVLWKIMASVSILGAMTRAERDCLA